MIRLFHKFKEISIEWITFSDGAMTCKINTDIKYLDKLIISVSTDMDVSKVLMQLELIDDALFQMKLSPVHTTLYIPYFPYARADRVFEVGNPHPLKVFIRGLARLNINEVMTTDLYNESAVVRLLDVYAPHIKLNNTTQRDIIALAQFWQHLPNLFVGIIAPDKGAVCKAKEVADFLRLPLFCANKIRCISTGKIINTELPDNMPTEGSVLIVDDILDGGGTFIPLANKIRESGLRCELYVTHLIASKGLEIFEDCIDKLHYYNIIGKYVNDINVFDFNTRTI